MVGRRRAVEGEGEWRERGSGKKWNGKRESRCVREGREPERNFNLRTLGRANKDMDREAHFSSGVERCLARANTEI